MLWESAHPNRGPWLLRKVSWGRKAMYQNADDKMQRWRKIGAGVGSAEVQIFCTFEFF